LSSSCKINRPGEHQQARGDEFLASPRRAGEPGTGDDSSDAGELLDMVTEILAGALLKLVGAEEAQQADRCWLDERRTRLAG
jgi:hypothetical protein